MQYAGKPELLGKVKNFSFHSFTRLQFVSPVLELLLDKQFHLAKETSVNFQQWTRKGMGRNFNRKTCKGWLTHWPTDLLKKKTVPHGKLLRCLKYKLHKSFHVTAAYLPPNIRLVIKEWTWNQILKSKWKYLITKSEGLIHFPFHSPHTYSSSPPQYAISRKKKLYAIWLPSVYLPCLFTLNLLSSILCLGI